ncbi:LysR family transcriptional regulator [Cystobacter ferrugineus]|uniref:LysR family transcriptional regulator n=1 Tax=Cystobacter ferrugineus TaxID=83449 RepID=A0A1L9B4W1_9BACT|nr:LysR family transcriptional regulator [Cystobacter ferrugineus]OJH37291.1 LysR family transcriptional regulator [Cystobacter ferrugineus]
MGLAWDDVQLFLAIAETGSLSAASKRLKVGQPTVSRRLADLEYRLGAQLFQRQVAGAVLTSAGERLLEPARHMAEWAAEVERAAELTGSAPGPRGVVRVTAAPGMAFEFVAPLAAVVRERYPELRLEVLSAVERLDLTRGEADLALRLQPVISNELVVLGSVTAPNAVMVAKSYAARLPRRPKLHELDWIAWSPPFDDVPPNPQLKSLIPDFRPVFTSDNYLVQWRACEAGLGAMIFGRVRYRFSLFSKLVPLDIDLGPHGQSTTHLVCAKSALALPRVRAVADLILEEFTRPTRL